MRPETSILTATGQGIQSVRFADAQVDRTDSSARHKSNAGTNADDIHIAFNGFAINVLFSVPEDLPHWLTDLDQQIDHMAWLEPNFDAEGSPAIRPENREAAKQLVRRLYTERSLQCTDAFPTAQGGVELELETRFWEAAVWVNDPESVEYFVKCSSTKRSGKASLNSIPDKIWESLG